MTGALRQEIYSGLRLPRERLVEVSLAETFSVSRMVIRQVLNMLKAEGLVGIEPYKGASVASISIDRIFQNYQVLAMLEGFSAKLSADLLKPKDLKKLANILDKQRSLDGKDIKAWEVLNWDFHRIINLRCGNDRLIQLIRQHIQFTTYWFLVLSAPGRITQNIKEHEDALKAFEKKDGEKARKFMERHIMGAGEYLTKHLEMSLGQRSEGRGRRSEGREHRA
ncbi:MAG: GntR family transcriptional regulator [Deltaproteobacteria bacterium]|nr:GntR family transcriptional regulator [Deltaproteobacteria bacterium]